MITERRRHALSALDRSSFPPQARAVLPEIAPPCRAQFVRRPRETQAIRTPPFYCPIEPAVHPDAAGAQRRRARRLLGSRSADFYARFAPQADPDRLWLAVCWVYWGVAFDDARCDEGRLAADPAGFAAMAGSVQRALETAGPYADDGPYAAAVHDLGERFRATATPTQVRRFVHRAPRLAGRCATAGRQPRARPHARPRRLPDHAAALGRR